MKLSKTCSVEELQVIGRYESLRKILLGDQYADLRDKPLAYWALPTDRRLPLALMGRTLNELLATPFTELADTPGIGQRKIRSFVKLLARVANTDPAELPMHLAVLESDSQPDALEPSGDGFDPAGVSEVVWAQWRASVVKHGLCGETLGRLAPSLKTVTRVVWNSPLGAYTGLSLAQIRERKTHGEKRVQSILEVFHCVHSLVAQMGSPGHLTVRIAPRLIDTVESWVGRWLQMPGVPTTEEISERIVQPLLEQIRVDASEQIVQLAENRLGIYGTLNSVRQAARTLGLTRARVYQLLNEINDIMTVRWPLGRHQLYELRDKFLAEAMHEEIPPNLAQYQAAVELFYPGSRRGAAGPLEKAPHNAPENEFFEEEQREQLLAGA
jgi:hypothetical protein